MIWQILVSGLETCWNPCNALSMAMYPPGAS